MTDQKENSVNVEPPAGLTILSQYIKDLSLEIPFAPEIFSQIKQNPNVHVDISISNRVVDTDLYEIALTAKINSDVADKKLFIVEVTYAALAAIKVPAEHLEPILFIELPRLLFPFVRSIISNNLSEAGLPPMMIAPIDFVALYQAKKAQEAAQAAQATQATPSTPAEKKSEKNKK